MRALVAFSAAHNGTGFPVPVSCGRATLRMHSVELKEASTGRVVAGEIGYAIGRTFTSLTGFFDRRPEEEEQEQEQAPALHPPEGREDGLSFGEAYRLLQLRLQHRPFVRSVAASRSAPQQGRPQRRRAKHRSAGKVQVGRVAAGGPASRAPVVGQSR